MTEAKKLCISQRRIQKTLDIDFPDSDDNFATHLAEQLRRLPYDSRLNAMIEIMAILNRFVRVQEATQ